MKNVSVIIFALLFVSTSCFAALPPKYLAIKAFNKCLAQKQIDTYQVWCMPEKKAKACPSASWKQLHALKGKEAIPLCTQSTDN